jgi:hypothetical protein
MAAAQGLAIIRSRPTPYKNVFNPKFIELQAEVV